MYRQSWLASYKKNSRHYDAIEDMITCLIPGTAAYYSYLSCVYKGPKIMLTWLLLL